LKGHAIGINNFMWDWVIEFPGKIYHAFLVMLGCKML
jgi:hypothetical protein